jgi:hypothetical protein
VSLRVELDRCGTEPGQRVRHHLHRSGVGIYPDDRPKERLGRIEHAVGTEVEAVQLPSERRSPRVGDHDPRRLHQVGIELIQTVSLERLAHEQTSSAVKAIGFIPGATNCFVTWPFGASLPTSRQ